MNGAPTTDAASHATDRAWIMTGRCPYVQSPHGGLAPLLRSAPGIACARRQATDVTRCRKRRQRHGTRERDLKGLYADDFQSSITSSFHLINSIRTASDHLVGDVQKLLQAGGDDRILEALFTMPAMATGQNLRQFAQQSREEREASLAQMWIFNVIGIYEAWADSLPPQDGALGCQFPSKGYVARATRPGFAEVFQALPVSPVMVRAYRTAIEADPRWSRDRIDDLLVLYRGYKELRNCLAHAGGEVSERAEYWGAEADRLAPDLHTGSAGPVPVPTFTVGQVAHVTMEQVRVLVNILFRISFTVDGAVLMSNAGEHEFRQRWIRAHGAPHKVPRKTLHRDNWLVSRLRQARLPTPNDRDSLRHFLKEEGLIRELL